MNAQNVKKLLIFFKVNFRKTAVRKSTFSLTAFDVIFPTLITGTTTLPVLYVAINIFNLLVKCKTYRVPKQCAAYRQLICEQI